MKVLRKHWRRPWEQPTLKLIEMSVTTDHPSYNLKFSKVMTTRIEIILYKSIVSLNAKKTAIVSSNYILSTLSTAVIRSLQNCLYVKAEQMF